MTSLQARHFLIGGAAIGVVLLGLSIIVGRVPTPPPSIIGSVGFQQNLDGQIPLDLAFKDESGHVVRLSSYFREKPIILMMGYYKCPNLCDLVRQGLATTLTALPFQVGRDYNVIAVSIDPTETPSDALDQQIMFAQDAKQVDMGIHFLTGSESAIESLAGAIGFKYAYDPAIKQYAHPSGVVILTPQGRISRYFYGIQYPTQDVRFGLVDASAGKIGSIADYLLLTCYHYDPTTGKYSLFILSLLRWAGVLTLGGMGIVLFRLFRGTN